MRRPYLIAGLAVLMIVSAVGVASAAITRFTDVPDTNVFAADIQWMDENEITTGCGPDVYCPTMNVTREQMAAFMHRLATKQVVDAKSLGGMAADEFATVGHDHDADYLGRTATAANSRRVDGYDANDLIRVAAWSFTDDKAPNDFAELGSFKITAPVDGSLMLSTSLELHSEASDEFIYCGFELDGALVNESATTYRVEYDAAQFFAPCAAEAVVPVEAGTYTVTVLGSYNYLLDTIFTWGTASALFVPFDGAGDHPKPLVAEPASANQMP